MHNKQSVSAKIFNNSCPDNTHVLGWLLCRICNKCVNTNIPCCYSMCGHVSVKASARTALLQHLAACSKTTHTWTASWTQVGDGKPRQNSLCHESQSEWQGLWDSKTGNLYCSRGCDDGLSHRPPTTDLHSTFVRIQHKPPKCKFSKLIF